MKTFLRMPARALAAVLLAAAFGAAADEGVVFGTVELAEGSVSVTRPDGASTHPRPGDWILAGSTLTTGADGELQLATEDSGYVALRPDTTLRIDGYRAEGGNDDSLSLSLLKGTFRSITGWIGRFNRDRYVIATPTATIGIRGTDHEPGYVTEEDAARLGEAPGTYDVVNDGGSYIQTAAGRADIAPSQSGFAPLRAGILPRLMQRRPLFYRPTRNEARIERRREVVRRLLEQRYNIKRRIWERRHPGEAGPGLAGMPRR